MERKTAKITFAIILLIVIAVGVYTYKVVQRSSVSDTGPSSAATQAMDTVSTFTNLDGTPIDLSNFAGKVRVVNSWASWCPFCVQELSDFNTLAGSYDREQVVVIAINRKEEAGHVKKYLKTINEVNNVVIVLDPLDIFYKNIAGFTMPETLFYNKEGSVIFHKRGFMTLEEMKSYTDKALAGETL